MKPRFSPYAKNKKPPKTLRYCPSCEDMRFFEYDQAISHSRCTVCGGTRASATKEGWNNNSKKVDVGIMPALIEEPKLTLVWADEWRRLKIKYPGRGIIKPFEEYIVKKEDELNEGYRKV